MQVIQSDLSSEKFNPNKIVEKINSLGKGLNIDSDMLSQLIISRVIDGITTEEINKLSADLANSFISTSYDYTQLASRLTIDNLYKKVPKSFTESTIRMNDLGMLSPSYVQRVLEYKLDDELVHSRDSNFDYLGVNSLLKSYLKKYDEEILETPQSMYMRVAVFLTDTRKEAVKLYHQLSNHEVSPASPIIFNAGTKESSLISCNLVTGLEAEGYNGEVKDPDSLEGIHELYRQASKLSAGAAGLGIDATDVRSKHSLISTSGGTSGGILKMILKPLNELMRGFNQKGSRPGAAAVYLEIWHMDVIDLLKMKRPSTSVEQACRDLFSALWVPDLFMERLDYRVSTGEKTMWTLFDPKSLKDLGYPLHTTYGKEFRELYEQAERDENVLKESIDIIELWDYVTASQMESGVPYILYKDRVNEANMQSNIGFIKQSNLCAEVLQVTDKETVANCVLSAVPIGKSIYIKDNSVDWGKLKESVYSIVKYLNKICTINHYPTPQAKKGGEEQRAIAIGLVGMADLFTQLDLAYDSQEALELNTRISEHMYFYALSASNQIAKAAKTLYGKYEGSPYQQGLLHFDKYLKGKSDFTLSPTLDWEGLRKSIKEHGVANSLLLAQMPCAGTAGLIGVNEAKEPFTNLIFKRTLTTGEFIVVNKHLVQELETLGLWSESLKNEIIEKESVQNIVLEKYQSNKTRELAEEKGLDYISKRCAVIKSKYKTAWELGAKPIINLAAASQPFIDQTQSMNIWMQDPNSSKLTSMLLYGWKKGLKTGIYYLRSSTVNNGKGLAINKTQSANTEIDCIGCTV